MRIAIAEFAGSDAQALKAIVSAFTHPFSSLVGIADRAEDLQSLLEEGFNTARVARIRAILLSAANGGKPAEVELHENAIRFLSKPDHLVPAYRSLIIKPYSSVHEGSGYALKISRSFKKDSRDTWIIQADYTGRPSANMSNKVFALVDMNGLIQNDSGCWVENAVAQSTFRGPGSGTRTTKVLLPGRRRY